MSYIKKYFHIIIILILIISIISSSKKSNERRRLSVNSSSNSNTKNSQNLQFNSNLIQNVFNTNFSKNLFYTTLYIGSNHIPQNFIIDTSSSLVSFPYGKKYKNYFKRTNILKCSSRICDYVDANACEDDEKINYFKSNICSYNIKKFNGDGILGLFFKDIVYFSIENTENNENDVNVNQNANYNKSIFKSFALPIGCSIRTHGKYRVSNEFGVLGMSNSPKALPNLLYNLGIIKQNIFSLCFNSKGGGYMSLGEINNNYENSNLINYIPLIESNHFYFIKLTSFKFDKNDTNLINVPLNAQIDTSRVISSFPYVVYNKIIKEFNSYCAKLNNSCGTFYNARELGYKYYCSYFPNKKMLFNAIYNYWPKITLSFGDIKYKWHPKNYFFHYYNSTTNINKACFGINNQYSERVSFGINFIKGHNFIFNRAEKKLGFIKSDCSKNNLFNNDDNETIFINGNNKELKCDSLSFIKFIFDLICIFILLYSKIKHRLKNMYINDNSIYKINASDKINETIEN